MKNKIIIIVFIMFLIWWWVYALNKFKWSINIFQKSNTWSILSNNSLELSTENINNNEEWILKPVDKNNKINELRKKLALRWLIMKWDNNFDEWNYISALVKYLQINKELPNDKSIINKLWDVNFNLKKFNNAYKYYSKIKDYNKLDKNKAAKTLIFSLKLSKENIIFINKELKTLWLSEEELFYYKNSLACKVNYSECRKEFKNYFDKKKNSLWNWTVSNEIKFNELNNILKAFENYENFQLEDLNYKWALVAWAFFENWLYPIAIEASKSILKEKSDYKPLIKIISKSHYELWSYIEAKINLLEYNKLVQNDNEASFFLWVIYEKLHEYILSTIHFNKAIEIWYKDKTDVYKRILYNYYELWDIDKILNTFNIMLTKNDSELKLDDYNLAIYYNIVNDNIENAKIYTKDALKKFPESEIFNWYMWWILMDEINKRHYLISNLTNSGSIIDDNIKLTNLYTVAEKYIDKWLSINSKSAMLNMIKGKLEINKWEISKSFIYFTRTISIDRDWEFWQMAKKELENIKKNK